MPDTELNIARKAKQESVQRERCPVECVKVRESAGAMWLFESQDNKVSRAPGFRAEGPQDKLDTSPIIGRNGPP